MQDEPKTPQDEPEVEAHHWPRTGAPSEDPGRFVGRSDEDEHEDEDEVQAHHWPRTGAPSEGPGRFIG